MALDAEKRIPDTTLPANSFKDGDILYGSDMNRVVDTLKTAVNENYKDLKGAVKGGDSIYINPIEGVVDSEGQPIDTVDGLIKWLYDNKILNEGKIYSLRINDSKQFEYYDGESWKIATVGQQGEPGEGVPTGGLSGQFLRKKSDASYDTEWVDAYDKEQVDASISSLEERLYKVNDGETTIENANGGSIRGIKLYGRSLQDGTPTPDNPIEIKSVVNPKLEVCGKNLWSLGTINKSSGSRLKIHIPKGTYTISRKQVSNDISFRFFTTPSMTIEKSFLFSLREGLTSQKLSLPTYIYGLNYNISSNFTEENEMQIELGSTATDYEPYKEQTATLPYTLNAIPVTSGGNITIDGQQYIADYVDIDNKQLVRMTKKSVFNGIENWELINSNNDTYCFKQSNPLENSLLDNYSKNYLSNMTLSNTTTSNSDTIGSYIFQSTFRLRVPSTIATTVDEFKAWVANNNITVLYSIATPTIINLTDEEVQAFKSLNTYEGVTNIIDSSDQISGSHKFIYNIADVIDNQCENIDKLNQLKPVTLGTTWTNDTTNGYYTQSVALSGITSKGNPTVDVVLSGTLENMQSQQEEWGKILKVETSTDALTFYASEATSVELSVIVKGV